MLTFIQNYSKYSIFNYFDSIKSNDMIESL